MRRKVYRATKSPELTQKLLSQTKHALTKHDDGSFYCEAHRCPADECASRQVTDDLWSSGLDGNMYIVAVKRLKPYHGLLTITRDGHLIHQQAVVISYNAPFGPDAEDVIEWQRIGIAIADADYRNRGEIPPA